MRQEYLHYDSPVNGFLHVLVPSRHRRPPRALNVGEGSRESREISREIREVSRVSLPRFTHWRAGPRPTPPRPARPPPRLILCGCPTDLPDGRHAAKWGDVDGARRFSAAYYADVLVRHI